MKYLFRLLSMSAAILIVMIGVTACDSMNRNAGESSITGADKPEPVLFSTGSEEPSSSDFTMKVSSSSSDVDLDADNSSTTEHLSFDATSTNKMDVTGILQITTGTASSSGDLQKVNPVYRAYENTPQSISYNGYSTLNYTINGTSYSASLNADQQNILDGLQQKLNEAITYGSESPDPCLQTNGITTQRCPEETTINSYASADKSVDAMTGSKVKKWLKEKGYRVKKLGNRRFQVVRKYKKNEFGKNMSITSVFNANTGKMEPGYTASKNGRVISENLSNSDQSNGKRHLKSKIKRSDDEYLLFEIAQKENN